MTKHRTATAALCAALTFALAGCEAQKSSNPLSPSVAGPIPGVNITAPKLVEPAQGFKVQGIAAADQAGYRKRDVERRSSRHLHVRGGDRRGFQ